MIAKVAVIMVNANSCDVILAGADILEAVLLVVDSYSCGRHQLFK